MNAEFWKPLDAATGGRLPRGPNAVSKIGSADWPGKPVLANPVRPLATLICRLRCAFWNSCRKLFSMMFVSLML